MELEPEPEWVSALVLAAVLVPQQGLVREPEPVREQGQGQGQLQAQVPRLVPRQTLNQYRPGFEAHWLLPGLAEV